ncbi:MAG: succinate dehydrogenase cytochrome b subunit [Candidatus Krumholzibacteria bacterium]|nr:succinate dehydrogenase cytochrome b subunit [Candidatus Krumholzibacteria bacterium]
MNNLSAIATSTVGRKILNGLTGLLLCIYILVHMAANTLIICNPTAFNLYAHFLMSLGALLIVIEILLLAVFVLHALTAITVWWSKQKARPDKYKKVTGAGGTTRKTFSSITMIYGGVIMIVFLVWHVATMKYGSHAVFVHNGKEMIDLYHTVVEQFTQGWVVIFYEIVMITVGFHLWHGFWSAFQSLGMNHPKYTPIINAVGYVFAIVIAAGFLAVPPYIYFTGGAP